MLELATILLIMLTAAGIVLSVACFVEDMPGAGIAMIGLSVIAFAAFWSAFNAADNNNIQQQERECANKGAVRYEIYRDWLCLTEDGRIVP